MYMEPDPDLAGQSFPDQAGSGYGGSSFPDPAGSGSGRSIIVGSGRIQNTAGKFVQFWSWETPYNQGVYFLIIIIYRNTSCKLSQKRQETNFYMWRVHLKYL